jgi:hypothetical protein
VGRPAGRVGIHSVERVCGHRQRILEARVREKARGERQRALAELAELLNRIAPTDDD